MGFPVEVGNCPVDGTRLEFFTGAVILSAPIELTIILNSIFVVILARVFEAAVIEFLRNIIRDGRYCIGEGLPCIGRGILDRTEQNNLRN